MSHKCHWPGCDKNVPPSMWGCKPHWFALPKILRDRIWATYRAGQEITKTPSMDYLDAATAVKEWIIEKQVREMAAELLEERDGRFYPTAAGCATLQEWLKSRGMPAVVSITAENRFDIAWSKP